MDYGFNFESTLRNITHNKNIINKMSKINLVNKPPL